MCGEKAYSAVTASSLWGSPPRVRGEAFGSVILLKKSGITPACAGRSPWSCSPLKQAGDHPRVCGEKGRADKKSGQVIGSPPRVRGEALDVDHGLEPRRITPACAGRRRWSLRRRGWSWDHPRVCGEKCRV